MKRKILGTQVDHCGTHHAMQLDCIKISQTALRLAVYGLLLWLAYGLLFMALLHHPSLRQHPPCPNYSSRVPALGLAAF